MPRTYFHAVLSPQEAIRASANYGLNGLLRPGQLDPTPSGPTVRRGAGPAGHGGRLADAAAPPCASVGYNGAGTGRPLGGCRPGASAVFALLPRHGGTAEP